MNQVSGLSERPTREWSLVRRRVVSVLLFLHLSAVMIAPWSAVDPRSQLSISLRTAIQPYAQCLYIDHGYRFFAPEPGPSHLIQYEITLENGEQTTGQFPDQDRIWPRLLYHRWFMLSETIHSFANQTLDDADLKQWREDVQQQITFFREHGNASRAIEAEEQYALQLQEHQQLTELLHRFSRDVARTLAKSTSGSIAVKLKMVTRLIPSPLEILDGATLDHADFLPTELQIDLGTHRFLPSSRGGQGGAASNSVPGSQSTREEMPLVEADEN